MKTIIHPKVGRMFQVKTNAGFVQMECVEWNSEKRVFKCDQGFVEMDWMEYLDQSGMGNIYLA